MDQYGLIKDGIVVNTAIFDNPTPELLEEFRVLHEVDELVLGNHRNCEPGATWNGIGFILPKPTLNPSFVLDSKLNWVPPTAYPEDTELWYVWDEETVNWVPEEKGPGHPKLG